MTDFQEITEEEAVAQLPFLLTMCERNRTVWKIKRKDGSIALLSPVKQSGPPVDQEVLQVVEEFRNSYIATKENEERSELAASLQERAEASFKTSDASASQKAS